jgi:antitoxin MazE
VIASDSLIRLTDIQSEVRGRKGSGPTYFFVVRLLCGEITFVNRKPYLSVAFLIRLFQQFLEIALPDGSPGEISSVSTLLTHGLQAGIVRALIREVLSKVRVTVKKWGNSAAVRLPTSVMKATQLEIDEVVEVREDQGRIVIEPVRPRRYELSELLKGITKKNQHREVDFGPAVGGEIW